MVELKKGDYVRINPNSEFSDQINEAGDGGKIVGDTNAIGYFDVKFKNYENGYREIDLIKITKQKWIVEMLK